MSHMIVKSKADSKDSSNREESELHFNVPIKKHNELYPSCYHYNILVMLAKRLVKEEQEKDKRINPCFNRWHLDKKFAQKVINV